MNAGHPPVLVARENGLGPVRAAWADQDDATELCSQKTVLPPGAALLLYTDGLTELTNGGGEMLDIEGVEKMLVESLAPTASQIDGSTGGWMNLGPTTHSDDRTFLVALRDGT